MAAFDEKEYTKAFDLKIWKRLLPILARYKKTIVLWPWSTALPP